MENKYILMLEEIINLRTKVLKEFYSIPYENIRINMKGFSKNDKEERLSTIEEILNKFRNKYDDFEFELIDSDYNELEIIVNKIYYLEDIPIFKFNFEEDVCLTLLDKHMGLNPNLKIYDFLQKIELGHSLTEEEKKSINDYLRTFKEVDYLSKVRNIAESIKESNYQMKSLMKYQMAKLLN